MTSRDFVYWLQGYFELLDPKMTEAPFPLGPAQVKCIRDHLQLVFTHDINPPRPVAPPVTTLPYTPVTGGITFTTDPPFHTWMTTGTGDVKVC